MKTKNLEHFPDDLLKGKEIGEKRTKDEEAKSAHRLIDSSPGHKISLR